MRDFSKKVEKEKTSGLIKGWGSYFTKKEISFLFLILAIGLLIRVYAMINIPLWRDEIYIFLVTHTNSLKDIILQNHWDTSHPSFYYVFSHFWQKISIDPLFLRLPSLIASVFTLYFIPVLAKEIWPENKFLPFAFFGVYILSFPQIPLSFEAKPYAFELLLMIISLIFFFRLLRGNKVKSLWIGFGVVNYLLFIVDYSGLWLIGSYGLFFLAFILFTKKKRELRNIFFKSFLITFLLSLSWIPIFVQKFPNTLRIEIPAEGPYFSTKNHFSANLPQTAFFVGSTVESIPVRLRLNLYFWNAILFAFSIVGIYVLWKKNRDFSYFLILGILTPVTFSFLFSIYISPIFQGRNLVHVNLFITLGYALAFSALLKKNKNAFILLGFYWIINFCIVYYNPHFFYADPPYDWSGVTKYIAKNKQGRNSYLVTRGPVYFFDAFSYYELLYKTQFTVLSERRFLQERIQPDSQNEVYFLDTVPISKKEIKKYQELAKFVGCKLDQKKFAALFFAECKILDK